MNTQELEEEEKEDIDTSAEIEAKIDYDIITKVNLG